MYSKGIEIPRVSFSTIDYNEIEPGSFFMGFNLDLGGKLCKIDHFGNLTVIEGSNGGGITSVSDDGQGIVEVYNVDPTNPIVKFNGIETDGTTITGDGTVLNPLIVSAESIIDVTHAELVSLKAANELIPGRLYRITDFQTIYDQPDWSGKFDPKNNVTLKISDIDPIIVKSISESELSLDAFQESYPLDSIKYILDFTTPVSSTLTKGKIIERIDEYGNRTDFDHRTVVFKRYYRPAENPNWQIYANWWDSTNDDSTRQYDILSDTPSLSDGVQPDFIEYVCTIAGTRDFGSGDISVEPGDWLVFNNNQVWEKRISWIELPTFNMSNPDRKPSNNYIEGYRESKAGLSDDISFESPFDLPNIVFSSIYTNDNYFRGGCLNFSFCDDTLNNDISAWTYGVIIKGYFIGNSIKYKFYNTILFGYGDNQFNGNQLDSITNTKINGYFSKNIGTNVYGINGNFEISDNLFITMANINSSYISTEIVKIMKNSFVEVSNIDFNYSQNNVGYYLIGYNNVQFLRNCIFYRSSTFIYCDIRDFSNNRVYGYFSYNKGSLVGANYFYGSTAYNDFGPSFYQNKVGPNFGLDTEFKQFLNGYEDELISQGYGNIIYGRVTLCEFGANVKGNKFNGDWTYYTIPSFFQNNDLQLAQYDYWNDQLDFSQIPEFIAPINTKFSTRQIQLTQQIIDDNYSWFADEIIFTDVDSKGNTRYWTRFIENQSLESLPFVETYVGSIGSTLTAIGSGFVNSQVIAKKDNWSPFGAISQVYGSSSGYSNNVAVPSKDELLLMYTERVRLNIGMTDIVWSSSEANATDAFAIDFSDGSVLTLPKTESHLILPISYSSFFAVPVLTYIDEYGSEIVKSLV